jgi:tetratricopeptide (TPR) repeat protein
MLPRLEKFLQSKRVALLLLGLLLIVRLVHLGADPPMNLSASSDVETDPAMYTQFARQYLQTGDFDPFNDHRLTLYLKSSITPLATVVFGLFGTGIAPMQLTGLIFSFGSLLFFFLFVRRSTGKSEAILWLLLAGFNYNLIFYGRLPFLEHAMTFFLFLALLLLSCRPTSFCSIAAGASLATGILFGKAIGILMIAVLVVCFWFKWLKSEKSERSTLSKELMFFCGGVGLVSLFWYFFVYLSAPAAITTYWKEQGLTAHGIPTALDSFDELVEWWLSFGIKSRLQPRMVLVSVLATAFIAWVAYKTIRFRNIVSNLKSIQTGHLLVALMMIGFTGALFVWNYRPLRYHLILIYPACAAAAVLILHVCRKWEANAESKLPIVVLPVISLIALPEIYRLSGSLYQLVDSTISYDDSKYLIFSIAAALIPATAGMILLYRKGKLSFMRRYLAYIAVAVVLFTLYEGISPYAQWITRPTRVGRDIACELVQILSKEAVVSGPYGPALTQGTELASVIHMFGMPQPDPDLFIEFPITHLLVDRANELRAEKDYPDIMREAPVLAEFKYGETKIKLYRVAEFTHNEQTAKYQLSEFEQAKTALANNDTTGAELILRQLFTVQPNSYTASILLADILQERDDHKDAEGFIQAAIAVSPTCYSLHEHGAEFYGEWFEQNGHDRLRDSALVHYDRAINLAPSLDELKECKAVFVKQDTAQGSLF